MKVNKLGALSLTILRLNFHLRGAEIAGQGLEVVKTTELERVTHVALSYLPYAVWREGRMDPPNVIRRVKLCLHAKL